jgi:hypothetical protein
MEVDVSDGKAIPRESWLRSKSHVRWAAAMTKCQHAGGHCGADGYCHYGDCFDPDGPPDAREVEKLHERVEDLEHEVRELRAIVDELMMPRVVR